MNTGTQKQKDTFTSSARAAQLTGYSQDYVSQLCRKDQVDCKRVAGEWQVNLTSLLAYKKRFSAHKESVTNIPVTSEQILKTAKNHKDVIIYKNKEYIPSADAATSTGYSQDYIGQLARSGAIDARKIGRKWFVQLDNLKEHKGHNDSLLAAIQAKSAGIKAAPPSKLQNTTQNSYKVPVVTYQQDHGALMPAMFQQRERGMYGDRQEAIEVKTMPSQNKAQRDSGRNNKQYRRISPSKRASTSGTGHASYANRVPKRAQSTKGGKSSTLGYKVSKYIAILFSLALLILTCTIILNSTISITAVERVFSHTFDAQTLIDSALLDFFSYSIYYYK